jgi:hypothetical protein
MHTTPKRKTPSMLSGIDGVIFRKGTSAMLCKPDPVATQATLTAERALSIALRRFPNLCRTGILGRRFTGPPIDLDHVETALSFLAQCRKSKIPNCHSFDLRRQIGGVSVGSVIVAAVALGFSVDTWQGTVDYMPHCLIGVDPRDVERRVDDRQRSEHDSRIG